MTDFKLGLQSMMSDRRKIEAQKRLYGFLKEFENGPLSRDKALKRFGEIYQASILSCFLEIETVLQSGMLRDLGDDACAFELTVFGRRMVEMCETVYGFTVS